MSNVCRCTWLKEASSHDNLKDNRRQKMKYSMEKGSIYNLYDFFGYHVSLAKCYHLINHVRLARCYLSTKLLFFNKQFIQNLIIMNK